MPVAAPPPDRGRPVSRAGRRRQRPAAAPLKPAAVAGMALLLALASLREPVPVTPTEAAWSDSALFQPMAGHDRGVELAPASDAQFDFPEEVTPLRPVGISDDVAPGTVSADDRALVDEERAGAMALQLASRLAWQMTGSFTLAPFGGVWAGPWPSASVMDSAIGIEQ